MSDNDDRDSGKTGAFLMGFLFGVLVSLGAGGTFYVVQGRQNAMMQMEAMMERDRAMAAEMAAREALMRAKAAERAAEEAKAKDEKDKK